MPNIAYEVLVKLFNAILKVGYSLHVANFTKNFYSKTRKRSNIFEILLQFKIKYFLGSKNAIPNHQFGF